MPGFEKKLSEMAGWVAPGGRLVIQNDPMAPLARRLIEDGWDFKLEFASSRVVERDLDALIFTRPKTGGVRRSADETRELRGRFLADESRHHLERRLDLSIIPIEPLGDGFF